MKKMHRHLTLKSFWDTWRWTPRKSRALISHLLWVLSTFCYTGSHWSAFYCFLSQSRTLGLPFCHTRCFSLAQNKAMKENHWEGGRHRKLQKGKEACLHWALSLQIAVWTMLVPQSPLIISSIPIWPSTKKRGLSQHLPTSHWRRDPTYRPALVLWLFHEGIFQRKGLATNILLDPENTLKYKITKSSQWEYWSQCDFFAGWFLLWGLAYSYAFRKWEAELQNV